MRPDQIDRHRKAEPFHPIRVHLSDGSAYDIHHPAYMYVSHREVVIGIDFGEDELPTRSVYCDPIHITRIEPLGAVREGADGSEHPS